MRIPVLIIMTILYIANCTGRTGVSLNTLEETKKCIKCDLGAGEFQGGHLQGINLEGANLERANFGGALLQGSLFQRANLVKANFENAQLQGADLRNANLDGANFVGANLQGADLENARLQGANFQNANLKEANLQRAYLTVGENTKITEARFYGGSYQAYEEEKEVNLEGANLEGVLWIDGQICREGSIGKCVY